MKHNLTKVIIGIISMTLFFSCEKGQVDNTYRFLKILKLTTITEQAISTIEFDYNDDGLLIKGNHSGGLYFTTEYDDSNRLIRTNSYYSTGPHDYFTFQYDSNSITRIRYLYYPYQDTWGGGNEKSVYCYNSQNHCERIDYYKKNDNDVWMKSDESTICTWTNDNLTEFKHYNGEYLEYTESYQYDDRQNPMKLLNYIISPRTKSNNNMISSSIKYSDGRESTTTFEYSYNEYGYPITKTILEFRLTEKYEYIIQ